MKSSMNILHMTILENAFAIFYKIQHYAIRLSSDKTKHRRSIHSAFF